MCFLELQPLFKQKKYQAERSESTLHQASKNLVPKRSKQ